MVDVGMETGLLVGLQLVGQRGGRHGRHEGGQEANYKGRKAHCGQGVRRVWDSIGMALLSKGTGWLIGVGGGGSGQLCLFRRVCTVCIHRISIDLNSALYIWICTRRLQLLLWSKRIK